MNRIISWIQNVFLRVIITLSLVLTALLISIALDYGNSFQAQAKPLTPEATKYEVNSVYSLASIELQSQDKPLTPEETKDAVNRYDSPFRENDQEKVNQLFQENKRPQSSSETTQKLGENLTKPQKTIKNNLEKAVDSVQEKLDLD